MAAIFRTLGHAASVVRRIRVRKKKVPAGAIEIRPYTTIFLLVSRNILPYMA